MNGRTRLAGQLLAVAAIALSSAGCPNPTDAAPEEVHLTTAEPQDGDEAVIQAGETLEAEVAAENREALLLILRGVSGGSDQQPVVFEKVRSIDRPVFLDIDEAEGPEQWITVAEIHDADGNVLWSDRVNSLYQLLEYLVLVLDQTSPVNFSVKQLLSFVTTNYPELLEFGVRVPLGIEGGKEYVLKAPRADADAEMYEVFRADIADLRSSAEAPSLTGEADTIVDNAEPERAIDIVILGDGYTADQREKFELDAQAISRRLLETEPFASHQKLFNIHTVWTPSNEAGAGYDCTGILTLDAGCKDDLRDTPFETVFVISALADKFGVDLGDTSARVAMPLQVARLYEAASVVPFDEIVMISNTRRTSGFAGLYVSILTAYDPRLSFPDTAVHELGHSFGVLGDEYDIEGDPCLENEPRIPLPTNISATADLDELKWAHHVAEGTPLPTQRTDGDKYPVGAYEGTYNCDELYRPSARCKMRNSDDEFCPVCTEQLVKRMYSVVDPFGEGPFTATLESKTTLKFAAPIRDEDLIGVQWTLGDEEVGTGATFELDTASLPTSWTRLTATVLAGREWVKFPSDRTTYEQSWWVRR